MTLVLLILKMIGILLLSVLGLVLVLLLLVLFVPIRYRAEGSFHEKQLLLQVKVSWLFHIFAFVFELLPEETRMYLRILGIRKNMAKGDNSADIEETIEDVTEDAAREAKGEAEASAKPRGEEPPPDALAAQEIKTGSGHKKKRASKPERNFFQGLFDRVRGFWIRLCRLAEKLRAAVNNTAAAVRKIQRLVTDERSRAAAAFLGEKLFLLLKWLLPKKLKLSLTYSTGSPDTTGELLGVLAMFPAGYQNRWRVTPDFTAEHSYAEADFNVQGRIFLYRVLGIVISVFGNRDCRRLYRKLKNNA